MNTFTKVILAFLFVMLLGLLATAIFNPAGAQTTQTPGARTILVGKVYWAIDTANVKTVFEVWDSSIQCPVSYYPVHDTIYLCPTVPNLVTIFTSQVPPTTSASDGNQPITLGVKFRSAITAFVKGIRFYKTDTLTGKNHTGYLYSLAGVLLDSGIFVNETATGWQTLTLTKNIQLTPNTTYIAAYYSPMGQYSNTLHGFDSSISNGIITGLASGTDGVNGVYNYGAKAPTLTYRNSNYWVDIVVSQQQ